MEELLELEEPELDGGLGGCMKIIGAALLGCSTGSHPHGQCPRRGREAAILGLSGGPLCGHSGGRREVAGSGAAGPIWAKIMTPIAGNRGGQLGARTCSGTAGKHMLDILARPSEG